MADPKSSQGEGTKQSGSGPEAARNDATPPDSQANSDLHGDIDLGLSGVRESSGMPVAVWASVGLAVLAVGILLAISARNNPRHVSPADATTQAPLDAYAANLPISGIVMSEAGSLAGGKLTYIDGHIRNIGARTVSGVTVQTIFKNDVLELPQVETLPLMLIRTQTPYVDLQPVSAAPLKPGDDREFRLIFEYVTPNWNQQYPDIHVIRVASR